jgi:8-oxo-dGTP pyrophosphatase MutT (NUDIX family)
MHPMVDPMLRRLARLLGDYRPPDFEPRPGVRNAAVALVVRPAADDMELLLIRRAEHERDPWSGHMAFPGGRHDPTDLSLDVTAIRETWEEVGIDLSRSGHLLGRLDAVYPRAGAPPVVVAPFVFAVPAETPAAASAEVHSTYWVPLATFEQRAIQTQHIHFFPNGAAARFPALRCGGHLVWGLTYRILMQLLVLTRNPEQEPGA